LQRVLHRSYGHFRGIGDVLRELRVQRDIVAISGATPRSEAAAVRAVCVGEIHPLFAAQGVSQRGTQVIVTTAYPIDQAGRNSGVLEIDPLRQAIGRTVIHSVYYRGGPREQRL